MRLQIGQLVGGQYGRDEKHGVRAGSIRDIKVLAPHKKVLAKHGRMGKRVLNRHQVGQRTPELVLFRQYRDGLYPRLDVQPSLLDSVEPSGDDALTRAATLDLADDEGRPVKRDERKTAVFGHGVPEGVALGCDA